MSFDFTNHLDQILVSASKRQAPRFLIHEISESHKHAHLKEWLKIHHSTISIVNQLGFSIKEVPLGTVPKCNEGEIFLAKHSRYELKDVWNIKKSYIPNYVYFDRLGYSGWAEVTNDKHILNKLDTISIDAAESFFKLLCSETVNINVSKLEQKTTVFEKPLGPFIFLPLQLSYDSVMALSYFDFYSFYEIVQDWCSKRGLSLVIKPHPHSASHFLTGRTCEKTAKILEDANNRKHVFITNSSIHHVIPEAVAVICINSGVGFESLIHLKPVITAGGADYHQATYVIKNTADLEALVDFSKPRLGIIDTKRYLYYFLNKILIDVREHETVKNRIIEAVTDYYKA